MHRAPESAPQATLRALTADDEIQARKAHAELRTENVDFLPDLRPSESWTAYLARIERVRWGVDLAHHQTSATFLVAEADGDLVGAVSVRHELNDYLAEYGGHVGYAVRPGYRRQGHATSMLRQALAVAAELELDRILVTCDVGNAASLRVIEKCGGRFERLAIGTHGAPDKRRYWLHTRYR